MNELKKKRITISLVKTAKIYLENEKAKSKLSYSDLINILLVKEANKDKNLVKNELINSDKNLELRLKVSEDLVQFLKNISADLGLKSVSAAGRFLLCNCAQKSKLIAPKNLDDFSSNLAELKRVGTNLNALLYMLNRYKHLAPKQSRDELEKLLQELTCSTNEFQAFLNHERKRLKEIL